MLPRDSHNPENWATNSAPSPTGTGALIACRGTSPFSAVATCSAACVPARSCASAVLAPRCGVTTTLGNEKSGESVIGSSANTSNAAPAMRPSFRALYSAVSSTIPPRATLTT